MMEMTMIIATALICLIAILIPKRITILEIYTSSIFVLLMELTLDMVFYLKYDYFGYIAKGVQWFGIIIQFPIYPAVSTIMLNYFPFYKKTLYKILYILLVTIIFTIFEWFTLKVGFLYYNGWKLWYSIIAYPVLISILALNLWIIRKMDKHGST